MYNEQNIFNKIIKGELPCKKIYEDERVLSFYDINPKSKIHALVIPKGGYVDFGDFVSKAKSDEIANFFNKANFIASSVLGLSNFKILTNNGKGAGQEVFHFHIHILG